MGGRQKLKISASIAKAHSASARPFNNKYFNALDNFNARHGFVKGTPRLLLSPGPAWTKWEKRKTNRAMEWRIARGMKETTTTTKELTTTSNRVWPPQFISDSHSRRQPRWNGHNKNHTSQRPEFCSQPTEGTRYSSFFGRRSCCSGNESRMWVTYLLDSLKKESTIINKRVLPFWIWH